MRAAAPGEQRTNLRPGDAVRAQIVATSRIWLIVGLHHGTPAY
jgi:hypothetical protein